jgi:hypothetical protein
MSKTDSRTPVKEFVVTKFMFHRRGHARVSASPTDRRPNYGHFFPKNAESPGRFGLKRSFTKARLAVIKSSLTCPPERHYCGGGIMNITINDRKTIYG